MDNLYSLIPRILTNQLKGKWFRRGSLEGQIIEFKLARQDAFGPGRLLIEIDSKDKEKGVEYPFIKNPNRIFESYTEWEVYDSKEELEKAKIEESDDTKRVNHDDIVG